MFSQKISKLSRSLLRYQTQRQKITHYRLLVAGLIATCWIISASHEVWGRYLILLSLILLFLFLWLVGRSQKLQSHLARLVELMAFYQRQSDRKEGLFNKAHLWFEKKELSHPDSAPHRDLSSDLDLIGPVSMESLLNESLTDQGRDKLREWFFQPLNSEASILARQKQIQDVARPLGVLRRLILEGRLHSEGHTIQISRLKQALQKSFLPAHFKIHFTLSLCLWMATLLAMIFTVSTYGLKPFLLIGFLFAAHSLYLLGKIGGVFTSGLNLSIPLTQIVPMHRCLEKIELHESFDELLRHHRQKPPTRLLEKLNSSLHFLSSETHPLIHFLINLICPWTAFFVNRFDYHRRQIEVQFPFWMEELQEMEGLTSLAIFYRYQTQVFPKISASHERLAVKNLVHPLIKRTDRVPNDFSFKAQTRLVLVTGSNMSGKSTFLRTIGFNQVLALMGAPVFASEMITSAVPVKSCLRVSDSLRDGFSYFYAEVIRLKSILDPSVQSHRCLYLIDEVFRGTNNRERYIGAKYLIKALAETTSFGFVTTHDLELTELERDIPHLANWHFREDVVGGEMTFSYQIQPGPCPTTNALKIMKLAGLPIPEV